MDLCLRIHSQNTHRLVSVPCGDKDATDYRAFFKLFAEAYTKILRGEPIKCAETGHDFGTIRPPDAVLFDVSNSRLLHRSYDH